MTVSLSISRQANEHAVRSHSLVKLCILLTSPLALGCSYSDIWAKRKAVIRITIRSIIWGGTRVDDPRKDATGAGRQRFALARRRYVAYTVAPIPVAAVGTSPNSSLTLRKHLLLRAFDLWPFLLIGISIIRFGVPVLACSQIASMDTERATRRT
jgi:hypothetical protein